MGNGRKFVWTLGGLAVLGLGAWAGQDLARVAVERVVHDYLLNNPEIVSEAMTRLQAKQQQAQLSEVRQNVTTPFPGAVLGNPAGSVTLVEFTDYACGYCRRSLDDVAELIHTHPQLRVVVREYPILSEHSGDAARMALAAAAQGKYQAFHDAMFRAGQVDPATIEQSARQAGLDMALARKTAASAEVETEIKGNMALADKLGFSGTPSWVAGDQLIAGAVGTDALADAIAKTQEQAAGG